MCICSACFSHLVIDGTWIYRRSHPHTMIRNTTVSCSCFVACSSVAHYSGMTLIPQRLFVSAPVPGYSFSLLCLAVNQFTGVGSPVCPVTALKGFKGLNKSIKLHYQHPIFLLLAQSNVEFCCCDFTRCILAQSPGLRAPKYPRHFLVHFLNVLPKW